MPVELVPPKRRLTAVLLADVVGYSRLMSRDEDGTHARIRTHFKELIEPTVAKYGGHLVRSMGDGMLVEFGSALDAVRCGLDIQQGLAERQAGERDQIQLRIGINTGDVIADDRDIYGTSVNITARLESIARPGAVYVSQSIHDQTRGNPGLLFTDRGSHRVKNIDYPIRVFEVGYGAPRRWWRRPPSIPAAGRMVAVPVVAIAIVVGVLFTDGGDNPAPRNSIIVLPFRNLSGNANDDYLADAITDDLTTDLSRMSRTFVIASATALTYKGKPVDARQIGRECGVHFLLEGSLRRVGATVQVNAQLINAKTGAHVWADRFTHESTTLLDLEQTVTGRIAGSLDIQLIKAEIRQEVGPGSLAADGNPLDERLRAMALIIGPPTPEKFLEARQHAETALKGDPDSAEVLALLADLLVSDYLNDWNGATLADVDRAEQFQQRALSIDTNIWMAHYAGGFIRSVRGDHSGSLAYFERTIALNPAWARAYAQKANQLVFLDRAREAPEWGKQAIALSPRDPSLGVFYWVIGRAYFVERDYANTVTWLAQSVATRPNLWFTRAWLIAAYALNGQMKEAQAAVAEFTRLFPKYTLQRIQDRYDNEDRYDNQPIKDAAQALYAGLEKAGVK